VEIGVGGLALTVGSGLWLFAILTTPAFFDHSPIRRPALLVLAIVVAIVVGGWCLQVAWRLFSGHERKWGGGLLSPFVLTVTGAGFCGMAMYMLWDRGSGTLGVATVFFGSGMAALSTAVAQRRRERTQRRAAEGAR